MLGKCESISLFYQQSYFCPVYKKKIVKCGIVHLFCKANMGVEKIEYFGGTLNNKKKDTVCFSHV